MPGLALERPAGQGYLGRAGLTAMEQAQWLAVRSGYQKVTELPMAKPKALRLVSRLAR